jgi:hypothetical protein
MPRSSRRSNVISSRRRWSRRSCARCSRAWSPKGPARDEARAELTAELRTVRRELDRVVEALATVGVSAKLTAALRVREARQAMIERELAGLDQHDHVLEMDLTRLAAMARERVTEWRDLLRRHVPQARQILHKGLRERLVFRPERRGKVQGYRFSAEGSIVTLLAGQVPAFSQAVASLTPVSWNQVTSWLKQIDRLRQAA